MPARLSPPPLSYPQKNTCRDSFSIDALYLASAPSGEPRTACAGKGPLIVADLAAAGLDLANVACAFQNYDRERRRGAQLARETGGLRRQAR